MTKPFTITELAAETKINAKMIRKFIKHGMRHVRVGKTIFIPVGAYKEFLASHETTKYKAYRPLKDEEVEA